MEEKIEILIIQALQDKKFFDKISFPVSYKLLYDIMIQIKEREEFKLPSGKRKKENKQPQQTYSLVNDLSKNLSKQLSSPNRKYEQSF